MIDSVKNHLNQSGFEFEVILLEKVKDLTILNELFGKKKLVRGQ